MAVSIDTFSDQVECEVLQLVEELLELITSQNVDMQTPSPPTKSTSVNDLFEFNETTPQAVRSPFVLKERSKRKFIFSPLRMVKKCKSRIFNHEGRIGYIFSSSLLEQVDRIPKVKGRASMVHELIAAYGLLKLPKVVVIASQAATSGDLSSFHCQSYLEKLASAETTDRADDEDDVILSHDVTCNLEEFGLAYDCPIMSNMYTFAREVAGSTLTALKALHHGHCSIAINWFGGWHHSKRDEASGFCYINDIVIGILWLLKQGYKRVLYVDFDLHHGDAVQDAFYHTDNVFTLSIHKYEEFFFPCTGDLYETGLSKGHGYTLNVPLKDGIRNAKYTFVTRHALEKVLSFYQPEIIIAQFGSDCIAGDPMVGFNITPEPLVMSLHILKAAKVPLLLLGGGGYNFVNTAKTWTILTSEAIEHPIDLNIPDHLHFLSYGPAYDLKIQEGTRADKNDIQYLRKITHFIDSFVANSHHHHWHHIDIHKVCWERFHFPHTSLF